jgi:hypothetical protein
MLAACSSQAPKATSVESADAYSEFRNYVRSCWFFGGNVKPKLDPVTLIIQMNSDKTLKSAEIDPADREKMSDPAYGDFARSALRAVQKCGEEQRQFPIPDGRPYDEWNLIIARFATTDFPMVHTVQ